MAISQDAEVSRTGIDDSVYTNMAASGPGLVGNLENGMTVTPGSQLNMIKKLYRHDCPQCESRWSEFAVVEEEQDDLTKRAAQIPIIHRHKYYKRRWITYSFTIQSSIMKDLLTMALNNYQDLDMELENWTFRPPYRPLVHRWDRLKELQTNTTDLTNKQAANTLMEFLVPILASSVDALSQTRRTGKISFEGVWQIFPPGELVMTKFFGVETICRVLKYERLDINKVSVWVITTEYVDWNGNCCGYDTTKATIREFVGFRRVTALPVYPLSFDDAAAEIELKMVERGRKFERLRGYHFVECSGKKVLMEKPEEKPVGSLTTWPGVDLHLLMSLLPLGFWQSCHRCFCLLQKL